MQKYQETVISSIGRPVAGAAVRVNTIAGSAPTIYSDNGITPITALVTDATGAFGFYADDGRYTITISGAGFPTRVIADVLLEDPADGSAALAASSGAALVGFLQSGTGATARTLQSRLRDFVSVKDFGAVGDGVTDDTSAFNLALAAFSASRTSPSGFSGWGLGTLYIPRGRYLVNGTITVASPIGLRFIGDGEYATTIIRTADTGNLFDFQTYIGLTFEHLAINHTTATAQATWTNTCFNLNGTGGGRILTLRNVTVNKFQTVIKHNYTGNEDTTVADHCTFLGCHTFLDSLNTQAVDNSYDNCSWSGAIQRVFYIAGQSQTAVRTANVTTDGTMFVFRDVSGNYNRGGFLLDNVKFEWTSANVSAGSLPKIMDANGVFISVSMRMRNVSLFGGSTPNADARAFSLSPGALFLTLEGGQIDGLWEFTARTGFSPASGSVVRLRDVKVSAPDTWTFTAGVAGSGFPNISFENCITGSTTKHPINLTLCRTPSPPYVDPRRTIYLANPNAVSPLFNNGTTTDIDYPVFGQLVSLNAAKVAVRSAPVAAASRVIEVFSDAARTVLIGTFTLPNAIITNTVYDIPITGASVTSAGFYVRVTIPAGGLLMGVILDFTSI